MTTYDELQDEAIAQARAMIALQARNHGVKPTDRELDEMALELYEHNSTLFEAMAMHALGVKWN